VVRNPSIGCAGNIQQKQRRVSDRNPERRSGSQQ
jgi:hypothetical protein